MRRSTRPQPSQIQLRPSPEHGPTDRATGVTDTDQRPDLPAAGAGRRIAPQLPVAGSTDSPERQRGLNRDGAFAQGACSWAALMRDGTFQHIGRPDAPPRAQGLTRPHPLHVIVGGTQQRLQIQVPAARSTTRACCCGAPALDALVFPAAVITVRADRSLTGECVGALVLPAAGRARVELAGPAVLAQRFPVHPVGDRRHGAAAGAGTSAGGVASLAAGTHDAAAFPEGGLTHLPATHAHLPMCLAVTAAADTAAISRRYGSALCAPHRWQRIRCTPGCSAARASSRARNADGPVASPEVNASGCDRRYSERARQHAPVTASTSQSGRSAAQGSRPEVARARTAAMSRGAVPRDRICAARHSPLGRRMVVRRTAGGAAAFVSPAVLAT